MNDSSANISSSIFLIYQGMISSFELPRSNQTFQIKEHSRHIFFNIIYPAMFPDECNVENVSSDLC
jgi:hypothetical protein